MGDASHATGADANDATRKHSNNTTVLRWPQRRNGSGSNLGYRVRCRVGERKFKDEFNL